MSFEAAAWAIKQVDNITGPEKLTLIILADCHNAETGQCNPSIHFLALRSCVHRRTVERALGNLEKAGFLSRSGTLKEDGSKGSNNYILHVEGVAAQSRRVAAQRAKGSGAESQGSGTESQGCGARPQGVAAQSRINQESFNQERNLEKNQGEEPNSPPPNCVVLKIWDGVISQASNYRDASIDDPLANKAIQKIGGWRVLGHASPADHKSIKFQFADAYREAWLAEETADV